MILHACSKIRLEEYHCFTAFDENFLVHAPTLSIMRVSAMAYAFFNVYQETHDHARSAERLVQAHGDEAAAEFFDALGYQDAQIRGEDPEEPNPEGMVDSLLQHHSRGLMLFVTTECNLHCDYCYESPELEYHEPHDLTTDDVEEILLTFFQQSGTRSCLRITFFGGEPLLRFDVIRHAVKHSLQS
ncbi:4Fe-4S cluster-binding domain-containing protein, partial [Candidatus Bipolaricaulota bacterium]|nr:4Fe-4S cluster-binding domain-containing protein [Candidatus Bipolaricaulota bacterium]